MNHFLSIRDLAREDLPRLFALMADLKSRQKARDRLVHSKRAVQRGCLHPLHDGGVKEDDIEARLTTHFIQHLRKRTCGNVELNLWLRGHTGAAQQ